MNSEILRPIILDIVVPTTPKDNVKYFVKDLADSIESVSAFGIMLFILIACIVCTVLLCKKQIKKAQLMKQEQEQEKTEDKPTDENI